MNTREKLEAVTDAFVGGRFTPECKRMLIAKLESLIALIEKEARESALDEAAKVAAEYWPPPELCLRCDSPKDFYQDIAAQIRALKGTP